MRTVTVAVLSFILGATLTSLYGSQTSAPHAPVQSAQTPNVDAGRTPVVPPGIGIRSQFSIASGGVVVLDGFGCTGCEFHSITLRYGGGVYELNGSKFAGDVKFELTGAAANTVAFLSNIGVICVMTPPPAKAPNPNRPIIEMAKFDKPVTVTLRSPYGQ